MKTVRGRQPFAAIALAGLVWAVTLPAIASGQESEAAPEDRARVLFQRGAEAYGQGRYDEAISLFQTGDRLAPRAAFSYNLAVAYEGKGEKARALEHYRNYQRRGVKPEDRDAIGNEIRRLERVLSDQGVQQVTIHVTQVASLEVDGRDVGVSPWTGELPPGDHDLVVRPTGVEPISTSFELPGTHAVDVRVDTSKASAGRSFQKPLAWALVGVTGAAVTAGAVLGAIAWDTKSGLDDSCGPNGDNCPAGSEGEIDTFRTTRTVSYVSFGLAAATAIGAVVLFAKDASDAPTTEVAVVPYDPGSQGVYVSLRQSF